MMRQLIFFSLEDILKLHRSNFVTKTKNTKMHPCTS